MICIIGAAITCAAISSMCPERDDRIVWAAAALGWAAIAVLAHHVG